jgi:hypothetical protein
VWTSPGHRPANVVPPGDLLVATVADLRRSGVPARLLTVAAIEAAGRLTPTAVPIRQAAEELVRRMTAIRSGRDAGGLENSSALDDLQAHLDEARDAATVLDRALRGLPGIDPQVAGAIDRVLARHPIVRAVEHLERAASLGRDVAIAQEWNRDLGVDSALPDARAVRDRIGRARRRIHELAEARPVPRAAPSTLERRLGMDVEPLTFVRTDHGVPPRSALGASLKLAVSAMLEPRAPEDGRDPVTRFGAALLRFSTAVTPEPIDVDLGRLAEVLRRLPDIAVRGFSAPLWAATVLSRLRDAAVPVLGRQQSMTDDAATAIRLPALVLAAEAVHAREEALAADLRRLAAATCLLRRRSADADLLETLILATA